MNEIKIYFDREKKEEITTNTIEFDTIVAGNKSKRQIYVLNTIKYPINISLSLEGDDIIISKNLSEIEPNELATVEFELFPKITRMKPIKAALNIKINYLVS